MPLINPTDLFKTDARPNGDAAWASTRVQAAGERGTLFGLPNVLKAFPDTVIDLTAMTPEHQAAVQNYLEHTYPANAVTRTGDALHVKGIGYGKIVDTLRKGVPDTAEALARTEFGLGASALPRTKGWLRETYHHIRENPGGLLDRAFGPQKILYDASGNPWITFNDGSQFLLQANPAIEGRGFEVITLKQGADPGRTQQLQKYLEGAPYHERLSSRNPRAYWAWQRKCQGKPVVLEYSKTATPDPVVPKASDAVKSNIEVLLPEPASLPAPKVARAGTDSRVVRIELSGYSPEQIAQVRDTLAADTRFSGFSSIAQNGDCVELVAEHPLRGKAAVAELTKITSAAKKAAKGMRAELRVAPLPLEVPALAAESAAKPSMKLSADMGREVAEVGDLSFSELSRDAHAGGFDLNTGPLSGSMPHIDLKLDVDGKAETGLHLESAGPESSFDLEAPAKRAAGVVELGGSAVLPHESAELDLGHGSKVIIGRKAEGEGLPNLGDGGNGPEIKELPKVAEATADTALNVEKVVDHAKDVESILHRQPRPRKGIPRHIVEEYTKGQERLDFVKRLMPEAEQAITASAYDGVIAIDARKDALDDVFAALRKRLVHEMHGKDITAPLVDIEGLREAAVEAYKARLKRGRMTPADFWKFLDPAQEIIETAPPPAPAAEAAAQAAAGAAGHSGGGGYYGGGYGGYSGSWVERMTNTSGEMPKTAERLVQGEEQLLGAAGKALEHGGSTAAKFAIAGTVAASALAMGMVAKYGIRKNPAAGADGIAEEEARSPTR